MSEAKSKKLTLWNLKQGQVVWSNYFMCYVEFIERDSNEEFLFKFIGKSGYCVLHTNDIVDPEGLMKELL